MMARNLSLASRTLLAAAVVIASLFAVSRAKSDVEGAVAETVLYHTESVLGKELIASGRKAGHVVDVLADPFGTVQAVVVDWGGFLGIGSRKIAVAWADVRFSPENPSVVFTNLSENQLAQAPEVKTGKPVIAVSTRAQSGSARPNNASPD